MPTTWTIAVDWNRDGDFSDASEDITSYIISANWFLGMRRPYQEIADNSLLALTLKNTDKRYSPENGSSPLFGSLVPFRPVRN